MTGRRVVLEALRSTLHGTEPQGRRRRLSGCEHRQGSAEFADFLAGSGRQLLQVARLLSGDHHRGEDLLQTALTRTYLRWQRVRIDDPYAYVRQALLNGVRDGWRRRRFTEVPLDRDELTEPRFSTDSGQGVHADRDSVLRALQALTARERQVIVLRYYEDLSESDIARVLGLAPGTVKSTAARGLGKLAGSPHLTTTMTPGARP